MGSRPGRIERHPECAQCGCVCAAGAGIAESSVASARQQLVSLQTSVDRAKVDLNTASETESFSDLIEGGGFAI